MKERVCSLNAETQRIAGHIYVEYIYQQSWQYQITLSGNELIGRLFYPTSKKNEHNKQAKQLYMKSKTTMIAGNYIEELAPKTN